MYKSFLGGFIGTISRTRRWLQLGKDLHSRHSVFVTRTDSSDVVVSGRYVRQTDGSDSHPRTIKVDHCSGRRRSYNQFTALGRTRRSRQKPARVQNGKDQDRYQKEKESRSISICSLPSDARSPGSDRNVRRDVLKIHTVFRAKSEEIRIAGFAAVAGSRLFPNPCSQHRDDLKGYFDSGCHCFPSSWGECEVSSIRASGF